MADGGGHGDYEVVLGPEALRVLRQLPRSDQRTLSDALRSELTDTPGGVTAVIASVFPHYLPEDHPYLVILLASAGYLVIYRRLTAEDLSHHSALPRLLVRRPPRGFYVFDILAAVLPG